MTTATTIIETQARALEPAAITEDMYQRFIDFVDASQRTVEAYRASLKQFALWMADNGIIDKPTRVDIISYKNYLLESGHKPTTTQNYMCAVRLFFRWTAQEGLYPNIADNVKSVKLDRAHKKDALTASQVRTVLDVASTRCDTLQGLRDYAIFRLMVGCGLRDIEVSRANVDDLRPAGDKPALYIQGKGRTERTEAVILPEKAERAIRAYLAKRGPVRAEEPLFVSTSNNNRGQRMTTRSISGIIKAQLRAAGYDSDRLTAHSLRHTAVTGALIGGEELDSAKQFARHSDVGTTMIYSHRLDGAKNTCSATVERWIDEG